MGTRRVLRLAVLAASLAACNSSFHPPPTPTCAQTGCTGGQTCESVAGGGQRCVDPVVVTGRVYDVLTTTGIADAVVVAQDVNGAPMSPAALTTTSGGYALAVRPPRASDGSPTGSVTLRADADGYATFPSGLRVALPIALADATHAGGRWVVDATANALADVGLAPLPPGTRGTIRGTVQSLPAGGALVVAECGGKGYSAFPGVGGPYVIFNVPPGTCSKVNAYAKGVNYAPATGVAVPSTGVNLAQAAGATATVGGHLIFDSIQAKPTSVLLVVDATYSTSTERGLSPPGLRARDVTGTWSVSGIPDGHYHVLAAFETDYLVRNTGGQGNTGVLEFQVVGGVPLEMDGSTSASALGNFKITGAVPLVAPLPDPDGACTTFTSLPANAADLPLGACVTSDPTPTIAWHDYSATSNTDHWTVTIVDELGLPIWQATNVAAAVTAVDTGTLPLGTYQVRVQSIDTGGNVNSTSEDLLGVFTVVP